jgi:hypothetical protein
MHAGRLPQTACDQATTPWRFFIYLGRYSAAGIALPNVRSFANLPNGSASLVRTGDLRIRNLPVHKVEGVREAIETAGPSLELLPPPGLQADRVAP